VYVFANPKPLLQWKINGKDLDRSRYTPIDNQRLKQNEVCGYISNQLIITFKLHFIKKKSTIVTNTWQ
jgi:hypothetical protein